MKPILYEADTTSFINNGLGRMSDALSCEVTEIRNGLFELELVYPVRGLHYDLLTLNRILYCSHDASLDPQPFDIYYISKPNRGKITVKARHISYRLSHIVTMPVGVVGLTAQSFFTAMLGQCVGNMPFSFISNVQTTGTIMIDEPSTVRSCLGDDDGKILDVFGGEYRWDMWTVYHLAARGIDRGVKIRRGKNVKLITEESDSSEIVTGIIPWWTGPSDATGADIYVELPEKIMYTSDAGNYPYQLTKPVDLSSVFENEPTVAELRAAAAEWLTRNIINTRGRKTYVVDMASNDAELACLSGVLLGDYVTVQDTVLDMDAQLEVVKTVWDVLRDRYVKFEIGDTRRTLAYDFKIQNKRIEQRIENTETKTTTIAKTASAAGTETHVEEQLQDPTSALSIAIANAGGGGGASDKKAGGANNTYGVFEDYDANDNKIMTVDNSGVKIGNNANTTLQIGNTTNFKNVITQYHKNHYLYGITDEGTEASPTVIYRIRDGHFHYPLTISGYYVDSATAGRKDEYVKTRVHAGGNTRPGMVEFETLSNHASAATTTSLPDQTLKVGIENAQSSVKSKSLTKLYGWFEHYGRHCVRSAPIDLGTAAARRYVSGIIFEKQSDPGNYFALWLYPEPGENIGGVPTLHIAPCSELGVVTNPTSVTGKYHLAFVAD